MSRDDNDRELDALMAEVASLKQRAAPAAQQPPSHLDDAIRAFARREVHVRPQLAGSPFSGRWRIPISIAAVVVISATVTLMVAERHSPAPVAIPPVAEIAPAAPAITPEPEQKQAPRESAAPERRAMPRDVSPPPVASAPTGAPQLRRKDSEAKSEAAPSSRNGAREPAEPGQTFAASPPSKKAAPQAATPTQTFTASPPPAQGADASAAASSPPSGQAADSISAAPSSRPATEAARAPEELREDSKSHLQADEKASADGPIRDYGVAQLRAPAMPSQSAESERRRSSVAAGRVQPHSFMPSPAMEADAADWQATPQTWLKHIEALRRAGLTDEARASFEAFRKRFPAFVLPEGFVVPTR